jgi:hypothetical protein
MASLSSSSPFPSPSLLSLPSQRNILSPRVEVDASSVPATDWATVIAKEAMRLTLSSFNMFQNTYFEKKVIIRELNQVPQRSKVHGVCCCFDESEKKGISNNRATLAARTSLALVR